MKNITTLLLVSIFLLTTTSASADYEKGEMKREWGEQHQMLPGLDDETKAAIQELHDSMQAELAELKESSTEDMDEDDKAELQEAMSEIRDAHHDEVIALLGDNTEAVAALEERKAEMEEKREEMMEEKKEKQAEREELLSTLDDDTRTALEELQADNKEALAELREDRSEDMTDEEKEAAKAQMTELRDAHQAAVAELLADYPEVLEAMTERKENMEDKGGKMNERWEGNMKGEKKEKDQDSMKAERGNKEYSQKSGEKKGMYKKQFATKYQARLEKASDKNLVKVLSKIEVITEKYENDDEITEERKENILAQLAALAEMIQEIVDASAE